LCSYGGLPPLLLLLLQGLWWLLLLLQWLWLVLLLR
jgi:hypothetical protein